MSVREHRRGIVLLAILLSLASTAGLASAHDLFLKFTTYFLSPRTDASVELLNGTFSGSENVVSRDRMADVSIVGPEEEVRHPEAAAWRDEGDTSVLSFRTGPEGTYTAGVSTRPRMIKLTAEEFADYLAHDGVLDVLQERRRVGITDRPARERYSKHVKAVFQVGVRRSGGWDVQLDHPVEFVPLDNPYTLGVGERLRVRFLRDGSPVAGQLVHASHEAWEAGEQGMLPSEAVRTITDADGVAWIPLGASGRWYVRTIHMVPSEEEGVDYVSRWATLTFEVR